VNTPLTAEQQQLLSLNVKLIPFTIRKVFGNINPKLDELYDVAVDALVKVARKWNRTDTNNFGTLGFKAIQRNLYSWYKKQKNKRLIREEIKTLEGYSENDSKSFTVVADTVIHNLIHLMDEDERKLLESIYGLNGKPKRMEKDIAAELGVTFSRVNYLKVKALHKMRKLAVFHEMTPGEVEVN
jgi:RNA polymerase sigma factor (sigma-70 family)